MRSLRPLIAVLVLAALAVGGVAGFSGAAFTSASANPDNVLSAARDWTPPTVAVADPGSPLKGTVTLTATASDTISGVATVAIQTAPTGTTTWTTACTDTASPYTCPLDTTTLADGGYDVRAVATDVDGNVGTSATVANRIVDNLAPVVAVTPLDAAVRGTITVSATASDAGTGVKSVRLEYVLDGGGTTYTPICTDTTAPYSCTLDTTKLATDLYDVRAVATDVVGNVATSTDEVVQFDNVAPTVTTVDPGSPLTGTVTISANAVDDDSGVDRVTIQYAPNGTTTWTDICTTDADPYQCSFDTTKLNNLASYSFRTIAYDLAGNTATSATVANRQVDNTLSAVTMNDPGAVLRGTVTLTATGSSPLGVVSIAIQRAPAGSTTYTTVCTDTAAPYSCSLNTATAATPDGLYDFRAVMTYSGVLTKTSAIVSNRRIDNAPFRGTDAKAVNRTGGVLGKAETGDTMNFTFTQPPTPGSIVPGWTGAAPVAIRAVLTDNSSLDAFTFTTTAGASTIGLGSLNLRGNYIRKNKTGIFNATVSISGSVVTVTLGTLTTTAGDIRTATTSANMTWTPSALAKDAAGNVCSNAPVTESGTAGRDF